MSRHIAQWPKENRTKDKQRYNGVHLAEKSKYEFYI